MNKQSRQKHSLLGHLKTFAIAALFGLGAYAIIRLILYLWRLMGLSG